MVAQTIGRVRLSDVTRSQLTIAALGLSVGLVLSDSSIVILALPEILDRFRVPIDEVSWVLTLFNLVLALVALPAAYLAPVSYTH
jgi:predicted MFS family arabinose efflux permease